MYVFAIIVVVLLLSYLLYKWWSCNYDLKRAIQHKENLKKEIQEHERTIEKLEKESQKFKVVESVLSRLSNTHKNYLIKTKYGETVVISQDDENPQDWQLFLNGLFESQRIHYQSKLQTSAREVSHMIDLLEKVDVRDIDKNTAVCISDISTYIEYRQRGYAQALLMLLVEVSKKQNLKTVLGWLAPCDKEGHAVSIQFFRSLGFEVYKINNDEGVIVKHLM